MPIENHDLSLYEPYTGRDLLALRDATLALWQCDFPYIDASGREITEPHTYMNVIGCHIAENVRGDDVSLVFLYDCHSREIVEVDGPTLLKNFRRYAGGESYHVLGCLKEQR
jgi:hypothetical protein